MHENRLKKNVLTAIMAALTCVATMVIQVPSPTGGYLHLGDGMVLLSGILLGPLSGALAAGIGSMLADLLSGYVQFAGVTLLIKACAAMAGGAVYLTFSLTGRKSRHWIGRRLPAAAAGVCGGAVVTGGYLLFESFLLGNGFAAAVVGVPANLLQNLFGILVAVLLLPLLLRTPYIRELVLDGR